MNPPASEPLDWFARLARRLRPDLDTFSGDNRAVRVTDVLGTMAATPLMLAGLAWLAASSDWGLFARQWPALLLMAVLIGVLSYLSFYLIADLAVRGGGSYGNVSSSLDGVIKWSAVFLFGPTVIWVDLVVNGAQPLWSLVRANSLDRRWNTLRTLTAQIATNSLLPLIALECYRLWGGTYPLDELSLQGFLLGAGVITVHFLLENVLMWLTYLGYTLWKMRAMLTPAMLVSITRLLAFGMVIPTLGNLFAAPLSGIYMQHGWPLYVMFALGLVLMAFLARRMTQGMEDSRRQAVQLEKLDALGRAILSAPPDNSQLAELLIEHAGAMFAFTRMTIWLSPDRWLFKQPAEWDGSDLEPVRLWLGAHALAQTITSKDRLPWQEAAKKEPHRPVILAPILEVESGRVAGGVFVELQNLGQGWDARSLKLLLPSLQSLAAQVASALHRAKEYERTLAHQKTQNELEFARRIQTSFLPRNLPAVTGWQLAASLEPARQIAGDFYDVIPFPSGRLGLLIADVADKGVGPALYMALSRTLIRTYAMQHETQPELVLESANQRILQDAGETLFVTAFYGVLDLSSGTLVYANAGHNPPWVLNPKMRSVHSLNKPGMPLGIEAGVQWKMGSLTLEPGDTLFLYTDGAADAADGDERSFGLERLVQAVQAGQGLSAEDLRAGVLAEIRQFTGDAPPFDDITLLVVRREDP